MSITQFIQRVRGMETPCQSYKLLDRHEAGYCPHSTGITAIAHAIPKTYDGEQVREVAIAP